MLSFSLKVGTGLFLSKSFVCGCYNSKLVLMSQALYWAFTGVPMCVAWCGVCGVCAYAGW